MKKIVDWTFGSVFRTFGRIIAYVIFGIAISYLLSSLDFRISDLFLDTVSASVSDYVLDYTSGSGAQTSGNLPHNIQTSFYTYTGTFTLNQKGWINYSGKTAENGAYTRIYGKLGFCMENGVQFTYATMLAKNSSTQDPVFSVSNTNQSCYYQNGGTYAGHMSYLYFAYDLTSTTYSSSTNIVSFDIDNYIGIQVNTSNTGYSIRLLTQQYGYGVQDFDNNDYIIQQIIQNQNQNTQSIINNQNNQTQQLLDDNTTQAESDAEGFFGDFDVPDVGGLSAIITAPLNTIRSLLSSSCSELVLPLPYVDEDLRLPCMNSIYTQHFGLFFNLYQTIILAIIAYRCIRSIYFDITGFTNPDDDRIEVMDL